MFGLVVSWFVVTSKKCTIASIGFVKKFILMAFSLPIKKFTKNLYFSYGAGQVVDGTGAQLQRLMTIAALCKFFNLNFIPSKINDFSVHPLDPFLNDAEYHKQLERLNSFLYLPNSNSESFDYKIRSVFIPRLTIRRFLLEAFRQMLDDRPKELVIFEAYPVTEFCPGLFHEFECSISEKSTIDNLSQGNLIVIHYRQGVGGNVIYPGQKIPRQIEFAKIIELIRELTGRSELESSSRIIVLTDAPDKISYYSPQESQQVHWEGTPGYANGVMTIQPMDFHELSLTSNFPVNVVRGGNPLDAITLMAMADILVMSKSSLSYVGALLNKQGVIYFPQSFWHKPLGSWITYDG